VECSKISFLTGDTQAFGGKGIKKEFLARGGKRNKGRMQDKVKKVFKEDRTAFKRVAGEEKDVLFAPSKGRSKAEKEKRKEQFRCWGVTIIPKGATSFSRGEPYFADNSNNRETEEISVKERRGESSQEPREKQTVRPRTTQVEEGIFSPVSRKKVYLLKKRPESEKRGKRNEEKRIIIKKWKIRNAATFSSYFLSGGVIVR